MKDRCFFSIIIPTYNRAHLINRAINSVLSQSFTDYEIIIVNDGSTDDTDSKIDYNVKIKYLKHNQNMGVTAAWRTGIQNSSGKYCCVLSDDDELINCALEEAYNVIISKPDYGLYRFNVVDSEVNKIAGLGLYKNGPYSYFNTLCEKIIGDYWVIFKNESIPLELLNNSTVGKELILWITLEKNYGGYYSSKNLYLAYREHGPRLTTHIINRTKIINYVNLYNDIIKTFRNDLLDHCPKQYWKYFSRIILLNIVVGNKASIFNSVKQYLNNNNIYNNIILLILLAVPSNISMFIFSRIGYKIDLIRI